MSAAAAIVEAFAAKPSVLCARCGWPVESPEVADLLRRRWGAGYDVIHKRRCPKPVLDVVPRVVIPKAPVAKVAGLDEVLTFVRGVHKKGLDGKRCAAAADMWTPTSGVDRATRWITKPPHICTCGLYSILHAAGYVTGPAPVEVSRGH